MLFYINNAVLAFMKNDYLDLIGNIVMFKVYCNDLLCNSCLLLLKFKNMYSGLCLITYWSHGRWLGPVVCPVCRQTVS